MVYKIEAFIPTKIVYPTLWAQTFDFEENDKSLEGRLDFLEELREDSQVLIRGFKQCVALAHDGRVKIKVI